ncbi:HlyD family secretion protein [Azohydromonas caseinilytica]|uniref:HlyD family efflux transporter periplasmic adaptor subunit n=1 Tax=Azohydromonas caseinilytica TaxID=2728836 RepID=A0A848F8S9_9BURK|nr:HlyD family efflux transporter periplasmic adaptor subunit [Azohydromonas caseinilytica]NML15638.1 HlyD family efflux transporter periplasmic adaptor subunit [Azohydromonas caseinilytica]
MRSRSPSDAPSQAREDGARGGTATLFRHEVLAARQAQWLGTVLLTPRLSHRVFTLAGALAAAAIVALLFLGHFTRTARVNGWLVPQLGVVRVFAPRPGVVTALQAQEGQAVRQGQPLLTLSDELQSATLGGVQAEVARQQAQRRESLLAEHEQQERLLAQQQRALAERVAALRGELQQSEREIAVLQARRAIALRNEKLHREQFKEGFISEMRLQLVEAERLEQDARLGALERGRLALERERMTAEAELADLPLKTQKELALIERNLAQLGQERVEAEARREIVMPAPQDGTVTSIQAVRGAAATTAVPLLAIVPAGSRLEAHLYGPSRAVGFVRPGQTVRLRYQAYPYQRFGHHEGVIESVSRSAVSPAELPPQLAGVADQGDTATAPGAREPIYRITVRLARQDVQAYGQSFALQPGMTLQADVLLERRPLYQWVLDPLYAVTGKLP